MYRKSRMTGSSVPPCGPTTPQTGSVRCASHLSVQRKTPARSETCRSGRHCASICSVDRPDNGGRHIRSRDSRDRRHPAAAERHGFGQAHFEELSYRFYEVRHVRTFCSSPTFESARQENRALDPLHHVRRKRAEINTFIARCSESLPAEARVFGMKDLFHVDQ